MLSNITEEKGKKSIYLAYIDSETEEDQKIQIKNSKRILKGKVVKKSISNNNAPYVKPILAN